MYHAEEWIAISLSYIDVERMAKSCEIHKPQEPVRKQRISFDVVKKAFGTSQAVRKLSEDLEHQTHVNCVIFITRKSEYDFDISSKVKEMCTLEVRRDSKYC